MLDLAILACLGCGSVTLSFWIRRSWPYSRPCQIPPQHSVDIEVTVWLTLSLMFHAAAQVLGYVTASDDRRVITSFAIFGGRPRVAE
ncbi:hypothetical protein V8C44DRAFT_321468 [Trichoderma aethiopicum]